MINTEDTLTSPISATYSSSSPLLGLTIVWHPDLGRVGEQFVGSIDSGVVELSRFAPLFRRPGLDGLALGHGGISRDPVRIVRDNTDAIAIHPSAGRMVLELNGNEIRQTCYLSAQQIDAGQILGLGRTILVCLHWIRCLPKNNSADGFLGVGSAAILARDQIHQVATTDLPVLILGETGTGKEIAARAIHALSKRKAKRLVTVNMATLNESLAVADLFGSVKGAYTGAQSARKGLFTESESSTLFLDEIGNTPYSVQPMLLRVIEGGDYRPLGAQQDLHSTARLIAATDQALGSTIFNQALLRRLESYVIHLPPLRARREDIGVLITHILNRDALVHGSSIDLPVPLVAQFARYDWPGNIRQLAHALQRAMLALRSGEVPHFDNLIKVPQESSGQITATNGLPAGAAQHKKKPADLSEQDVLCAMENNHWFIQAAAQELGISRPSMYKLLRAHTQIRPIEKISEEEIKQTMKLCGGLVENCAAHLKTPTESLRRYLRTLQS